MHTSCLLTWVIIFWIPEISHCIRNVRVIGSRCMIESTKAGYNDGKEMKFLRSKSTTSRSREAGLYTRVGDLRAWSLVQLLHLWQFPVWIRYINIQVVTLRVTANPCPAIYLPGAYRVYRRHTIQLVNDISTVISAQDYHVDNFKTVYIRQSRVRHRYAPSNLRQETELLFTASSLSMTPAEILHAASYLVSVWE